MAERILSGKIKQLIYTTEELSQSPLSTTVIDNGVLVYEKTSSGQIKCKMGDGNNVWSGLNYIEDSDKMDKNNPTGTGSLSMNRLEGSIVGENSVALGIENIASEQASYAEGIENISGNYDRFSITSRDISKETIDNVNMICMNVTFSGETFPILVNDYIYLYTNSGIIKSSVQNIINTNTNSIFKIYVNENKILNSIIDNVGVLSDISIIYTNNNSDGSICSHSEGCLTLSNGSASHSEGCQTKASNMASHAEGYLTIANGMASHAEGVSTTAIDGSHAEGVFTKASSIYQHVQGKYNIEDTSGTYAHIVGGGTGDDDRKNIHTLDWNGNATFSGDITATDSEGNQVSLINDKMDKNNPTGTGSFSMNRLEGSTIGSKSHAEGDNTTASGEASHAEGFRTSANGLYSHAEGYYTQANGKNSHAEGNYAYANGVDSHAEGRDSKAKGNYSHSEGAYTKASSDYQHVQGKYNIEDTTNTYAHIVGGGTGNSNRKNIHTLDWNGNAVFSGDVTATKSDGTEVSLLSLKSTLDSIQVQNFYTGIEAPSNTLGEDGDLYLIT